MSTPPAGRFYPRSFTVLVAVAMTVLTLPLAAGLANSILVLQQVMVAQRDFARTSLQLTRDVRRTLEAVSEWQRIAGQYHLLQAVEFAGPLRVRYLELAAAYTRLHALLGDVAARRRVADLARDSAALYRQLVPGRFLDSAEFNVLSPRFERLHASARAVLELADAQVLSERQALERTVESTRNRLIVLALALIPLTLALAATFFWLIQRPIRQLKRAIHLLGRDELAPLPVLAGPGDLVELGREIDWLRQRLLALEAQKAQFLRHVSHELKTPLASLREGVALLHDGVAGPLNARQRGIVDILDQAGRGLQKRIEDLLLYSEMVRGRRVARPAPQTLADAVQRARERHRLALDARGLALECVAEAPTLIADPDQLDTVLDNLLGNAIRFSPDGGRIGVFGAARGDAVDLDVCDQGPGITEADRERVFDPFYQGARQPESAVRGSGLGLSIVAEILHAAGGGVALVERPPWSTCIRTRWPQT